jgi:hypothetical protein
MIIIYNGTSYHWESLCKADKELMRESYLKALAKNNAIKVQKEKEISQEPEPIYKPRKKRK